MAFLDFVRRGLNYRNNNYDIYAIRGIPAMDSMI